MSPFAVPTDSKPSLPGRFSARPLIIFLLCLVLGLGALAWRANVRATAAHNVARVALQARASALELQFQQAISAVEVLGALARQSGGAISNFRAVAGELLATRPAVASLELQPSGVVSDVAPRSLQRVIGFNVLQDAAQRPWAYEAIKRRALTVSLEMKLATGEKGFMIRVPLFQRARNGREYFWGFVAASMRLEDALLRARVPEPTAADYRFVFFLPSSGHQKAQPIAWRGSASLVDSVQTPVRAHNLQFGLALQPSGGWLNKTKLALEGAAVLLVSVLLSLLVNMLENRREVDSALSELNGRLSREITDRKQAQGNYFRAEKEIATAQSELKQTRYALKQAETMIPQLKSQMQDLMRNVDGTSETVQAKAEAAESKLTELQRQLETTRREAEETAQAREGELELARAALEQAQAQITDLQSRLDAAGSESTAATQTRLEQNQVTIAELQKRLDVFKRSAAEAAEANAARLKQLEANNQELRARVLEAEVRAQEFASLLQQNTTELEYFRQHAGASTPESNPIQAPVVGAGEETAPVPDAGQASLTDVSQAAHNDSPNQPTTQLDSPAPEKTPQKAANAEAPRSSSDTEHRTARAAKRKKNRRDDQFDFFAAEPSVEAPAQPPAAPPNPAETDLASATPIQPAAPSGPSSLLEPEEESIGQLPGAASTLKETAADAQSEEPPAPAEQAKPAPARRLPPAPPVDPTQLRKAVHEILPLLADRDPGAKDCLKANRNAFRSAFSPEAYLDFEQLVKKSQFGAALEQLRRAAKRHGIST